MVAGYNADPDVHGILVQLPLPKHIDEQRILEAISIEKDVDGFHPANLGSLAMRGRNPLYVSCTPKVRSVVLLQKLVQLGREALNLVNEGSRRSATCTKISKTNNGAGLHRAAGPSRRADIWEAGGCSGPQQYCWDACSHAAAEA